MKVAINGAGIAGPTLAYWLHRFGHESVLIEQAPRLRTGGYVIDFWGVGYDIAEKMGLLPSLKRQAYYVQELRWVNSKGKTSAAIDVDVFREMTQDRYLTIERSVLSASIFDLIDGEVETLFGDSVAGIMQ